MVGSCRLRRGRGRKQQRHRDNIAPHVLAPFAPLGYLSANAPDAEKLTPADPSDLAAALSFGLRYQGRKRVHNADGIMAEIVARRLVEHLDRAGFVIMKRPPEIGAAALGRGFERK